MYIYNAQVFIARFFFHDYQRKIMVSFEKGNVDALELSFDKYLRCRLDR